MKQKALRQLTFAFALFDLFFIRPLAAASPAESLEITPREVREYVLEAGGVQQFQLKISALEKNAPSYVTLRFQSDFQKESTAKRSAKNAQLPAKGAQPNVEFFTNHIKWIETKNGLVCAGINGKPLRIDLSKEKATVTVFYRFSDDFIGLAKKRETAPGTKNTLLKGVFQISDAKHRVLKEIPGEFYPPPGVNELFATLQDYAKETGLGLAIFLALLFAIFMFKRNRQKEGEPAAATRARFSTLLEPGVQMKVMEYKNPFGRRLTGLGNGVRLKYDGTEIKVHYSGKTEKHSPKEYEKPRIPINEHWVLGLEVQTLADEEQAVKRVRVLLIPSNQ